MRLTPSVLELDLQEVEKRITRFIKEYVENAGADGIALGLSGGVDSNTIAALSSLSIGGERVMGLLLPEQETFNQKDVNDAMAVAEKFGLKTQIFLKIYLYIQIISEKYLRQIELCLNNQT